MLVLITSLVLMYSLLACVTFNWNVEKTTAYFLQHLSQIRLLNIQYQVHDLFVDPRVGAFCETFRRLNKLQVLI